METGKDNEYIRYGTFGMKIGWRDLYLSYSREELNALRYYQGDTSTICLVEEEKRVEDFYQISNAYEVLNTLLFSGISNEKVRIVDEKRKLSPLMLENISEVLHVYENLATLFYKYTINVGRQKTVIATRFDRENSLISLKEGENCSFMSATLAPDLEYFHKKSGLVLEIIEADPHILYIDVNEVLGKNNHFSSEREILFPPFCVINLEQQELSEEELTYTDIDNHPPLAKYKIHIIDNRETEYSTWTNERIQKEYQELKNRILDEAQIENAKSIWNTLKDGGSIPQTQGKTYEEWKRWIHKFVELSFAKAGRYVEKKSVLAQRYNMFCDELQDCIKKNNMMREAVKGNVEKSGIAVVVCGVLVSFFLALSFVNNSIMQMVVKIMGLVSSSVGLIITGICKAKAWEGKFQQRTIIYLKLDQLQRDLRYETNMNQGKLDNYIKQFKEILLADATYCENNVQMTITYLDETMKKDLET